LSAACLERWENKKPTALAGSGFWKVFRSVLVLRSLPLTASALGFDPIGADEMHRAGNARDLSLHGFGGEWIHFSERRDV
jgi:hypothetical protein